jgi:hypothetical protein
MEVRAGQPTSYLASVEAFVYDSYDPAESNLVSLASGYYPGSAKTPEGLIQNISWVTNTLVDASEDWVDKAVHRQWPGLMQVINIDLPSDIGEDDLSPINVLLEAGKNMADRDWKQTLGTRGAAAKA